MDQKRSQSTRNRRPDREVYVPRARREDVAAPSRSGNSNTEVLHLSSPGSVASGSVASSRPGSSHAVRSNVASPEPALKFSAQFLPKSSSSSNHSCDPENVSLEYNRHYGRAREKSASNRNFRASRSDDPGVGSSSSRFFEEGSTKNGAIAMEYGEVGESLASDRRSRQSGDALSLSAGSRTRTDSFSSSTSSSNRTSFTVPSGSGNNEQIPEDKITTFSVGNAILQFPGTSHKERGPRKHKGPDRPKPPPGSVTAAAKAKQALIGGVDPYLQRLPQPKKLPSEIIREMLEKASTGKPSEGEGSAEPVQRNRNEQDSSVHPITGNSSEASFVCAPSAALSDNANSAKSVNAIVAEIVPPPPLPPLLETPEQPALVSAAINAGSMATCDKFEDGEDDAILFSLPHSYDDFESGQIAIETACTILNDDSDDAEIISMKAYLPPSNLAGFHSTKSTSAGVDLPGTEKRVSLLESPLGGMIPSGSSSDPSSVDPADLEVQLINENRWQFERFMANADMRSLFERAMPITSYVVSSTPPQTLNSGSSCNAADFYPPPTAAAVAPAAHNIASVPLDAFQLQTGSFSSSANVAQSARAAASSQWNAQPFNSQLLLPVDTISPRKNAPQYFGSAVSDAPSFTAAPVMEMQRDAFASGASTHTLPVSFPSASRAVTGPLAAQSQKPSIPLTMICQQEQTSCITSSKERASQGHVKPDHSVSALQKGTRPSAVYKLDVANASSVSTASRILDASVTAAEKPSQANLVSKAAEKVTWAKWGSSFGGWNKATAKKDAITESKVEDAVQAVNNASPDNAEESPKQRDLSPSQSVEVEQLTQDKSPENQTVALPVQDVSADVITLPCVVEPEAESVGDVVVEETGRSTKFSQADTDSDVTVVSKVVKPADELADSNTSAGMNEPVVEQTDTGSLSAIVGVSQQVASLAISETAEAKRLEDNLSFSSWEDFDSGESDFTVANEVVLTESEEIEYLNFKPKNSSEAEEEALPVLAEVSELGHVLEIYEFDAAVIKHSEDFRAVLIQMGLKKDSFGIKWVDEKHALVILSSAGTALDLLSTTHPVLKVRLLTEASVASKDKAVTHIDRRRMLRRRADSSRDILDASLLLPLRNESKKRNIFRMRKTRKNRSKN